MAYHSSTQRQEWLFANVQILQDARSAAHTTFLAEEGAAAAAAGTGAAVETAPTPTEAIILLQHYEREMSKLCAAGLPGPDPTTLVPFSDAITATAVAYFKRYYVHNSILKHPPHMIMRLALFVACKSEKVDLTELRILLGGRDASTGARYVRSSFLTLCSFDWGQVCEILLPFLVLLRLGPGM
jgi:cyclin H